MNIRNIAIIAHVDHGKTTLVDQLLKQSETLREREEISERAMDSNDLERERGITILAKNTAINYKDYRINILDTPGHADFGGEVERIMRMVDGVLLVVDALDGTMPQTKFVLRKALEAKVKPIVVINKVDREFARPLEVVDEVLELFLELEANDDQLNFPIVYVSALLGTSSLSPDIKSQEHTMKYLFDSIVKYIPEPTGDPNAPLQFQPALLDYNDYVGRTGIGKITQGTIRVNDFLSCIRLDGSIIQFRVQKLYGFLGLKKVEKEVAYAGDIVAVGGLSDIGVGETLCNVGQEKALPPIKIEEPTVQMTFGTNTSPFSGLEGKLVTASKIEDRLIRETQKDVSLRVARLSTTEEWIVSGRGELHLSILIETMRREGYEFQVSCPKVIIKNIDGVDCEPYEYVQVDAPNDSIGSVIELMGIRKGIMKNLFSYQEHSRLIYEMPSRGLIGFNTDFMTATKGYGTLSHVFLDYRPSEGGIVGNRKLGVLVASASGKSNTYGIDQIEDRGTLFIGPGEEVYEGMIVGECNREDDLAVNVTKAKNLTNQRSSVKDFTIVLKRPRTLSLEESLNYINDDELVELTPKSIRLRKRILDTSDRKRFDAYNK